MKNINDFMDNNSLNLTLSESSILYIKEKFIDFDSDKLEIEIFKNFGFSLSVMYTTDNQNWSIPKSISDFEDEIDYYKQLANSNNTEFYCYIKLIVKLIDDSNQTFTQLNNNNANFFPEIIFSSITYDGKSLLTDKSISVSQYIDIIKKFPSWNLYDNQQITIDRWLSECVAVNNRIGHGCFYFKTEPDRDAIDRTLVTITKRDVVAVKKIIVSSPENELPTDRNTFSEWDMPMIDDFIIHIPTLLFNLIFGNEIPSNKDFIYLPILNKLYTINSVQPGQKFMGVTGWWECYLIKYEDDENINKDKLIATPNVLDSIKSVLDVVPNLDEDSISSLYERFENIVDDGLQTSEKNLTETTEQKKEVTDNFSNKLVDSTSFVSLKETENQRDFYNKRLEILTINPDSLAFPLNMYNPSTVELKHIALSYDLIDATKINKFKTDVSDKDKLLVAFNFVLLKRFNSDILDFFYSDSVLFTIRIKGKNLIISKDSKEYIINYKFEENYFYQINITEKSVSIFILENKQKKLIHIFEYVLFSPIDNVKLSSIKMYGGNYYIGNFMMKINDNKIIEDKTLPVLKMNSFGL